MDLGRSLTTVGAGITTFVVVAVLVIELLDIEFSALIGVPVGVVAGLIALVGCLRYLDELDRWLGRAISAYAAFGLLLLLLAGLRYVNIGREVLSVNVVVGAGVAGAIVVYLALWVGDR